MVFHNVLRLSLEAVAAACHLPISTGCVHDLLLSMCGLASFNDMSSLPSKANAGEWPHHMHDSWGY